MYLFRITCILLLLGISDRVCAAPEWIWVKDGRKAGVRVEFSHTLKVNHPVVSARLQGIADFASLRIRINEKPVARAPAHGPLVDLDVTHHLLKGENRITLFAVSMASAPAVALQLDWIDAKGGKGSLSTDRKWKSANIGRVGLARPTIAFGSPANEPWWDLPRITLDSLDDYTQWKRASKAEKGTDPETFFTLPGYEVELLRSAGKDENSWVSLAFDPKGRLTIGREDKGLLRYTFSQDRRKIIRSETINDTLKECRGLLYAHGALYANANNSKALYRLRDLDGDDQFEEVKSLYQSEGGVGHGRNDLALGPDGKIYAIQGDSVRIPENIANRTSPLRPGILPYRPNEGHVVRMDKDGGNLEVFCGGLRNPYGIAFNREGESFTYDADAENDMGTPWYRPTQVKHLRSGADFGWRAVTGSWPPYYPDHPDNAQPSVHIGKGSPTSVKFGHDSNFPPAYRNALFILDWTYGRILAIHMMERGAGYFGVPEVFLQGSPLNLTDLGFGPDGALYFVTGGRRTKSALYRVRHVGSSNKSAAATLQLEARTDLSRKARDVRRRLEALHRRGGPHDIRTALEHLGNPDPAIRYAARIALEHQPHEKWRGPALQLKAPLPALAAWTALIHADPKSAPVILDCMLGIQPGSLPEDLLLEALHLYSLCLAKSESPPVDAILKQLHPLFPNPSPVVNWVLAPILVELDPKKAVGKTMRVIGDSRDPVERVHHLYNLRQAREGWTPDTQRAYFQTLGEASGYIGDSRGLPRSLTRIRNESLSILSEPEKIQFTPLAGKKLELPPLPDLSGRKFVRAWKPDDFVRDLNFKADEKEVSRGRKIFAVALCSRCHRFHGEGYPVGPDLSGVANRLGRRDLLRSILLPSETIAQNHRTDILELKSGQTMAGQIIPTLDYRAPHLLLAENPIYPDQVRKIAKLDVVSRRRSDVSIMPPGLLNNLEKQEILQLLAFLESTGR